MNVREAWPFNLSSRRLLGIVMMFLGSCFFCGASAGILIELNRSQENSYIIAPFTAAPPTIWRPMAATTPAPRPAPTETSIPTITPTATRTPTNTPEPTPTLSPCTCFGGRYDCGDFDKQAEAQACYDYCLKQRGHDVHGLDGNDNDGVVCESLP